MCAVCVCAVCAVCAPRLRRVWLVVLNMNYYACCSRFVLGSLFFWWVIDGFVLSNVFVFFWCDVPISAGRYCVWVCFSGARFPPLYEGNVPVCDFLWASFSACIFFSSFIGVVCA